jgi:hypothetical protein
MIFEIISGGDIISENQKPIYGKSIFFILLFVQYMGAILDIDFKITNNTWDARIRYTANR